MAYAQRLRKDRDSHDDVRKFNAASRRKVYLLNISFLATFEIWVTGEVLAYSAACSRERLVRAPLLARHPGPRSFADRGRRQRCGRRPPCPAGRRGPAQQRPRAAPGTTWAHRPSVLHDTRPVLSSAAAGHLRRSPPGCPARCDRKGSQDEISRMLLNGTCEVALTYDTGLAPGLRTATVYSSQPYFCSPWVTRSRRRMHLLSATSRLNPSSSTRWDPAPHNAQTLVRSAGLTPRIAYHSSNIEVVRSRVARGLGWTTLAQRWPSELSLEGLPLVRRPISEGAPTCSVVAGLARQYQAQPPRGGRGRVPPDRGPAHPSAGGARGAITRSCRPERRGTGQFTNGVTVSCLLASVRGRIL
jgi:hypothetical protein